MQPKDYGVFSLGLINRALVKLDEGVNEESTISESVGLSKGSIHNHLKVGKEFGLVRQKDNRYYLTDRGDKYISNNGVKFNEETLTQNQINILKEFISKDPFYSPTVFGIFCIVESTFLLSRNSYPIELSDLKKVFLIVAGKINQWSAEKTISTATYSFLNFAIDLELLGKIGTRVVITPSGFKFILMLQLHKSIEMIDSLPQ